jgi:hypothetical protein
MGMFSSAVAQAMEGGAFDFKTSSGQSLPSDVNRAAGRSFAAAFRRGTINEADANTLKRFMGASGKKSEGAERRSASRVAPNSRSGRTGVIGGRGKTKRPTLLGDASG